jgi:hypothetical protein
MEVQPVRKVILTLALFFATPALAGGGPFDDLTGYWVAASVMPGIEQTHAACLRYLVYGHSPSHIKHDGRDLIGICSNIIEDHVYAIECFASDAKRHRKDIHFMASCIRKGDAPRVAGPVALEFKGRNRIHFRPLAELQADFSAIRDADYIRCNRTYHCSLKPSDFTIQEKD